MKCPNCNAELSAARRDGIEVEACAACGGMWLSRQELDQLENEAYDLGKKGTLVFGSEESPHACPQCQRPLRRFHYRDYELELEFCEDGHGYWLDKDDDKRVLELMRREEHALQRKFRAEDHWSAQLQHWRTPGFIDRLMDLLR
jgi:Zn-finger nucleic acid-binding protein